MIKGKIWTCLLGMAAGFNAYAAADNLLEHQNNRAVVIQSELAKASELTSAVYKEAKQTANDRVGNGNLYIGLTSAVCSGLMAGCSLYCAGRKED